MPSAYIHYLIPWAEWSPHNYVFIDVTTCSDYIRASTDAPIGHAELAHPVQGTSTSHAPACLQNPTLTDSFLSQRTPGRTATKSRLLEIPAYKKLLLPEVVTHCCHHHWYLKPSVLYMEGGGEGKEKKIKQVFSPLFVPSICCYCMRPLHALSACLPKACAGFSHSNIGKKVILKTTQKCDK